MSRVHELLRADGLAIDADREADDRRLVHTECARLARRMRERLVHTLGLVPAADDVAVPAVAIELGRALADKRGSVVGVIDALGGWGCARALIEASEPDGTLLPAKSWVLKNLAVVTPPVREVGAMIHVLGSMLMEQAVVFSDLVVDLTGFDHMGEQLAAFDLLDAVAVVARGGVTTTQQIRRWLNDIPSRRGLGVLLTGL